MRLDESTLHDRFDEVLVDAGLDLHGLAARAELDGRRLRARRRLLSVAGCAVAVALVTVGGAVLTAPGGTSLPAPPIATQGPPDAPSVSPPRDAPGIDTLAGPRVPATGNGVAYALADVVGQLVPGRATSYAGQDSGDPGVAADSYARIAWDPEGAEVATPVRINIQDGWRNEPLPAGSPGYQCEQGESIEAGTCEAMYGRDDLFFSCSEGRLSCTTTRRDGVFVVSYEERHHRGAVDRIVDVLHIEAGLRVVVASTNASEFEKAGQVTEQPPLTLAQLREIALVDAWGLTIPQAYVEAGAGLGSYQGLGDTLP